MPFTVRCEKAKFGLASNWLKHYRVSSKYPCRERSLILIVTVIFGKNLTIEIRQNHKLLYRMCIFYRHALKITVTGNVI